MDLSLIARNLRDHAFEPDWWRDIAVPFLVRSAVVKPYFRYVGNDGDAVMNEDWDNLLILDACRYDMFAEHSTLSGRLERRTSRGSNTAEFLRQNFADGSFEDTVYVTANPQVDVNLDAPFHDIVSVWTDGWDDEFNTVRPERMVKATIEAHETYPEKRLISHFVQPHYPFIGERGRTLVDDQAGIELSKRMATDGEAKSDHYHIWDLLKRGEVSERGVWAAYVENLQLTLPHIETLLSELVGRIVVTADHGNLVGERPLPCPIPYRMYGHPPGVYADKLVTVPWLVSEADERKKVVAERGVNTDDGADADAAERLRDLGYL